MDTGTLRDKLSSPSAARLFDSLLTTHAQQLSSIVPQQSLLSDSDLMRQ